MKATLAGKTAVLTLCVFIQIAVWRHICSKHGLQRGRRTEQHHHDLPEGNCYQHYEPIWLLGHLGLYRPFLR